MPVEFGLWRIDGQVTRLVPTPYPSEAKLESLLAGQVGILGLDVFVLGRQVLTPYGKRVDLLALDVEGDVYVIELKRDKTPREVVAQALDYGSWARNLSQERIREIYAEHGGGAAFEEAFADRFGVGPPEALNQQHHLVIVASELDPSTERIVTYLSSEYGVRINAIFFRYFVVEGHEYLARTWLIEPHAAEILAGTPGAGKKSKEPWNGHDFYVSVGEGLHRSWDDWRRFGFISGGGGRWYSRTLEALGPGDRVFACIPSRGYVGVGIVREPSRPVTDFTVDVDGVQRPVLEAPLAAPGMGEFKSDRDRVEHAVRVEWIKTVPKEEAVWEKGMFANQNTACALRSAFTLDRLAKAFSLDP